MDWHPITEDLPHNVKYSSSLLLYAPDLVDLDFNPSGVVDGHWRDEGGDPEGFWEGAIWSGYIDEFITKPIKPTHYAVKQGPKYEEISK